MYCIKCGVKLADTEKKCPLCGTVVYHPDFEQTARQPLYPDGKLPDSSAGSRALNATVLALFLLPLFICFFADFFPDRTFSWFGYVAGALVSAYITLGLPLWFKKPNPVIFAPCNFAAAALYLLYVNHATGGGWFLSFAFPVVGGLCLITCACVALLRYLHRGRLYILGGAFMALGVFMPLIEFLMRITFCLDFIGWSLYPFVVFVLSGGLLIYLAMNSVAREIMERKLFF